MPSFLEKKLRANVPRGVDPDRYVYGAMNHIGAMRGNKITAKGRRMEAKHERKVPVPSMKRGGFVPLTGLYRLHQGENVIPASEASQRGQKRNLARALPAGARPMKLGPSVGLGRMRRQVRLNKLMG